MKSNYIEPESKCSKSKNGIHQWLGGWIGEYIIFCNHCNKETLKQPKHIIKSKRR